MKGMAFMGLFVASIILLALARFFVLPHFKIFRRFFCWMGNHSFPDFIYTGSDGASMHARCRWCGYEGMIDSQGNLF